MNTCKFLLHSVLAFCIAMQSYGQEPLSDLPSTLKYNLDLKIDYRNTKLYGKCDLTLINNTGKPVEKIPLLLYRQLSVKSATDETGAPLSFSQDILNISGWEKIQVNFIEILLDTTLAPGNQTTIKVVYEGFLSGYSADGWRYVKDHIAADYTMIRTDGFGYPLVGHPTEAEMMAVVRERYDYTIDIKVPVKKLVVTGGELVKVVKAGDEAVYSFKSKKPSWRLDIAIGDYLVLEKNRNKVFCFSADTARAKTMLDELEKTVETYSGWFGDINDYKGYSIIEVPDGYGSQADVASMCLTADNFKDIKENTGIYHELAHLWDVKPLETEPCRFESEGRAQFLQFLLLKKFSNRDAIIQEAIKGYLDNIRKDFTEHPEFQSVPVRDYGSSGMTQYSYTLGMVIFSMYYDLVGEENFNKAIRSYCSAYQKTGATLGDFISCCKKYAPFKADKFFDDFIYSTKAEKMIVEGISYDELKELYR